MQPVTLQGLIAARLDALALADKELLQAAAVIGKVFWTGSVAAVVGRDSWSVDERLRVLEHRELVRHSRISTLTGDSEWAFGHVLVRDVAYGQIPRADRAEMHRISGEWIESLGRPDDHAELVAHHYLSALELGGATPAIAERARVALRAAGERAFALHAFAAAARLFGKALELWPADDHERPLLELNHGRALYRGKVRARRHSLPPATACSPRGTTRRLPKRRSCSPSSPCTSAIATAHRAISSAPWS